MADDNRQAEKLLCNYCRKSVVKSVVECSNCAKVFHSSCGARGTCCDSKNMMDRSSVCETDGVDSVPGSAETDVGNALKMENQELKETNILLKKEIEGLKLKINVLESEIAQNHKVVEKEKVTLNELNADISLYIDKQIEKKIATFQREINYIKAEVNKTLVDRNVNSTGYSKKSEPMKRNNLIRVKNSKQNMQDLNLKVTNPNMDLITRQEEIMNEIINLAPENNIIQGAQKVCKPQVQHKDSNTDEDGSIIIEGNTGLTEDSDYTLVTNRRKKNMNGSGAAGKASSVSAKRNFKEALLRRRSVQSSTGTGTVNRAEGFAGREQRTCKKVWLFISHVRDHVTDTMVREYINQGTKTGLDEIVVKEIPVKYQREDSKCFQVGVNYDLKEMVYKPEFWPAGVKYRRFKFNFDRANQSGNGEQFLQQGQMEQNTSDMAAGK